MQVSRGSLDSLKYDSPNIMLAYENRSPDMTLMKFKLCERQTYPNRQLKCSPTISILQYPGYSTQNQVDHISFDVKMYAFVQS